jgi:hypothetical protein
MALPLLASTSGPFISLGATKDDDDGSQDGAEDAHLTKPILDEHGHSRPNTSDPQQPASRPVILLSNGKPLKSSLKSSSSLVPTIEFPQEHHTHYQRARSDFDSSSPNPESPTSSSPPQKNVQTSSTDTQQPTSRPVILLSNGKPLKSSLKSSSSLVPTIKFPQEHHTHHQRARSDFDSSSPNLESPTSSSPQTSSSDTQQSTSRPVILLSDGKPLKSSLKSSSSSSVPPHSLENVHFSELTTVKFYNKSASLFHNGDEIERHTDDLNLPVLWGRSWNRVAADPFPKLFSVSSPPFFPCGPSTTAQVMDALRHTDEEFLSTIAAFIRHVHAHSLAPSIGFMYDLSNAIVGLVGRLLTLIQAVLQHPDTPPNSISNLRLAKEELHNVTISLAVHVRSLTVSLSSSISEETDWQNNLQRFITGTLQAGADCVAAIKVCLACSISDIRFIVDLPSPMLIPAISSTLEDELVAMNSFSGPGEEYPTFQVPTSSQKKERPSPWHFMNSDKMYQSTRLSNWIIDSSVSMKPQIEEEDACMYSVDFLNVAILTKFSNSQHRCSGKLS